MGWKYNYCDFFFILILFLLVGFLFPNFLKDSTYRYINHTQYFEKPSPFEFILQNSTLEALQQEDYLVELKVKGSMLPDMVNIKIDGQEFSMKKNNKTAGTFSGFVLLEEKKWDKAQFKKDFADDWELQPVYEEGDDKKEAAVHPQLHNF